MAPRKILIVEDFEDLRNLVCVFLCARGYEVLEANTGRAAIQTALTGNPDFILLDFRLPDISGLEVARELHKIPDTGHIPIVGFTADCGRKPYEDVLRAAGIMECLEKPVSMRELEAVIQRFAPLRQD